MREELPRGNRIRWCVRRKIAVVRAIDNGSLPLKEACERYNLTNEEIERWRSLLLAGGSSALRATRVQDYRGH